MKVAVSGSTTGYWKGWARVPQKPNRVAGWLYNVADWVCDHSGHIGACGMLNQSFHLYRGERHIASFRNPWYRLICWMNNASSDFRFERVEVTTE